MQIYEIQEPTVERDMDLIRELLLTIEADKRLDGTRAIQFRSSDEMGITGHSTEEVGYHLNLLLEAGYLAGFSRPDVRKIPALKRLTWQGHEFLDNIKNEDIWSKTKARLSGLPQVALSVIAAIAESEIRKKMGLS